MGMNMENGNLDKKEEIIQYNDFETENATRLINHKNITATNSTESSIDNLKQRIQEEAQKIALKKIAEMKTKTENVKKVEERVQATSEAKAPKINVDSTFMADMIKKLVNKKMEEKQKEATQKSKPGKRNRNRKSGPEAGEKKKKSKKSNNAPQENTTPSQGFITITGSNGTTIKNNHVDNNNSGNSGVGSSNGHYRNSESSNRKVYATRKRPDMKKVSKLSK